MSPVSGFSHLGSFGVVRDLFFGLATVELQLD